MDAQTEAPSQIETMHEAEDRLIARAAMEFPKHDAALYGTKSRPEFILAVFQAVEGRCAYEGGWIAHRMTWLVISQSFLFSAFAVAATNIERFLDNVLVWLIIFIALVQAISAFLSINAAKKVNRELMDLRSRVDGALKSLANEIPIFGAWIILGENRYGNIGTTFKVGGIASRIIPITLILGWAALLIALLYKWYFKQFP